MAALVVLYAAAMWLMSKTGATMLTARQMAMNLLCTARGIVLIAVVVVWAAVYPKVGFVVRRVEGDTEEDGERILNAFLKSGYVPAGRRDDKLIFRAASPLRRLRLLFEDEITVTQYGQWIELTGIRRSVAEVEMRLGSFIRNANREQQQD